MKNQAKFHGTCSTFLQNDDELCKILIKIMKASDLGGTQDCNQTFCVVELDEPPQKHQTSFKWNTNNPVWEEAFLL